MLAAHTGDEHAAVFAGGGLALRSAALAPFAGVLRRRLERVAT